MKALKETVSVFDKHACPDGAPMSSECRLAARRVQESKSACVTKPVAPGLIIPMSAQLAKSDDIS
jgi:hypothetical protein